LNKLIQTEVVVVGGGPAGAVAARALAHLGREVVLCESASFPRPHVGISLSPGVEKQLAFLGLDGQLDRPCHRKEVPMLRRWGTPDFEISAGPTFTIVDRGVFDADLLAAARDAGVRVLHPARVGEQTRTGERWRLAVYRADSHVVIDTRFVVEATGRRMRFRRRRRYGANTLALCGTWIGAPTGAMRLSAGRDHWCWATPTGPHASSLICFVDPQRFQQLPGSLRERYVTMAEQSGVLPAIEALTLCGEPFACNATPCVSEEETAGILCVGDADLTLDPLSSSGVQAAIQSSLAIGPIVNTLLTPGADADAAMDFWRTSRMRRLNQHRRWSQQLYSEALCRHRTAFWAERAGSEPASAPAVDPPRPMPAPDQLIRLSGQTKFIFAPCLAGGLVERMKCISHLGEPMGFLGKIHLATKLQEAQVFLPASARRLVETWSTSMSPSSAFALLTWAWKQGVLVDASQDEGLVRGTLKPPMNEVITL
jgi:2-polyprenyl-6-methoxyphenol hydroxylase-like FAD-dependent oxidoreductase